MRTNKATLVVNIFRFGIPIHLVIFFQNTITDTSSFVETLCQRCAVCLCLCPCVSALVASAIAVWRRKVEQRRVQNKSYTKVKQIRNYTRKKSERSQRLQQAGRHWHNVVPKPTAQQIWRRLRRRRRQSFQTENFQFIIILLDQV